MASNLGGLALFASLIAVVVGGYVLIQDHSAPADLEERMVAVEDQLARIEVALAKRGTPSEREPTLLGLGDHPADATPARRAADGTPMPDADTATTTDTTGTTPTDGKAAPLAGTSEEIAELVDKAVAKKAGQMQVMRNKKPHIDAFAKTLELTEAQRKAAEQGIVRAQNDIKTILEIPAEDGTNFMDELVEVIANGIAAPAENAGRGIKFFGRLLTETVPGTNETYAARIEGVKQGVRDAFKRDWTKKQYGTFQAWQMDPTEVKDIDGSPWKALEVRIIDRAKQLGAEIPDKGEDD